MIYRTACIADIDLLVSERLNFIKVKESDVEYETIRNNCYHYFEKAITENLCDILLAEDQGECIGTGIIFYYLSVPSTFNSTGKNAYITSVYVKTEYRRQGIGSTILKGLINNSKLRGYDIIMLNTSEMGKPMYHKMGFTESHNGMIFDNRVLGRD